MITKVTQPVIETINGEKKVTGFTIEYRLFGILLYKKESHSIDKYGTKEVGFFLNP
ncbi:hypothetical protein SAMN05216357_11295 [Porphyromonadaceae bacterium KH3CP3RA]|nr:hypothetical protein SAMN05216357_11295 [Porphyromonadaceae bacterium KH3CP3RA]